MKNINKNLSIIIFIVFSNIVLKLPFINNPISDWHSWNQITTVATARYIVEDGWASLFNAKVDLFESFKEDSNATFAEFPILSGLIALGFMVTGDEYEWAARLINILISSFVSLHVDPDLTADASKNGFQLASRCAGYDLHHPPLPVFPT